MNQQAGWRKSSYSQGANACVEASDRIPGRIAIHDSKPGPDSPIQTVTAIQWRALLNAIRAGELDA